MADNGALAISRGIPLAEEPGQGTLTLPGFLREVARRHGPAEAVVEHRAEGRVAWSYDEMQARAIAVARALVACGVGKDSRVGILMANRLEWVSTCFGIAMAGATVVGLSTFSTADELDHLLRASGVSLLLFEPRVLGRDFAAMLRELEPAIDNAAPGALRSVRFPFLRRLVAVDAEGAGGAVEGWGAFLAHGETVDAAQVMARSDQVHSSDPALLFFSSGSTGKPKGILNAHRGVCVQSWRWPRIYAVDHPVRFWSANGLFWSGNFSLAMGGTFAAGGTLVLQRTFDPGGAIRLFADERVTFPYCWPHQWAQLEADLAWSEADLSSFWYIDAEVMLRQPQRTITRPRPDPRASYGATETFTISASYPVDTPRAEWEGSFGTALPGNTIRIADPGTGETLRIDETGEIAVKGPTLMLGYIGVPREEALDDQGYYRSGDGGHIDDRGRVIFAGRINDIVKTGGANVSPVEVDWTLCSCPGVKVCKTTGVPHETLGEMVVSLVVAEAGHDLAEAQVIAWLKQRLATYKVPRKVLFVDEADFGMTDTAKIKPAEARALAVRLMA